MKEVPMADKPPSSSTNGNLSGSNTTNNMRIQHWLETGKAPCTLGINLPQVKKTSSKNSQKKAYFIKRVPSDSQSDGKDNSLKRKTVEKMAQQCKKIKSDETQNQIVPQNHNLNTKQVISEEPEPKKEMFFEKDIVSVPYQPLTDSDIKIAARKRRRQNQLSIQSINTPVNNDEQLIRVTRNKIANFIENNNRIVDKPKEIQKASKSADIEVVKKFVNSNKVDEDSSDISGFTANYIRSTRVEKLKHESKLKSKNSILVENPVKTPSTMKNKKATKTQSRCRNGYTRVGAS